MSVLVFIEMKAKDVSLAKEQLEEMEYVLAFYELVSDFNVAVIAELENEDALFEFLALKVRTIPGIKESRTHIIQDGIAF